jgi:hypothetical protein
MELDIGVLSVGDGCQGKSGYDSRSYLLQASLSRGAFLHRFVTGMDNFLNLQKYRQSHKCDI